MAAHPEWARSLGRVRRSMWAAAERTIAGFLEELGDGKLGSAQRDRAW
ncbi:MAG: hypothetical protein N2544_03625 [Burkholderiales bacterium]|nr:hypothetical protein [Burkholderiales bacterium]